MRTVAFKAVGYDVEPRHHRVQGLLQLVAILGAENNAGCRNASLDCCVDREVNLLACHLPEASAMSRSFPPSVFTKEMEGFGLLNSVWSATTSVRTGFNRFGLVDLFRRIIVADADVFGSSRVASRSASAARTFSRAA